jgi:hypothetical protein
MSQNKQDMPVVSGELRQQVLMYLRDKAFNDAVGPIRKEIAGEWLLQRDSTLINKLVEKHLEPIMELFESSMRSVIDICRIEYSTNANTPLAERLNASDMTIHIQALQYAKLRELLGKELEGGL